MNSRRTVIIAAALALAALAFFGNVYYLHSAQTRAYDNAKLVRVFVVKKAIPKGLDGGQAISQDYVKSSQMPQEYRPGSAVADINDIKGKVAINDLSPGQVVVDGQFVDANVAQVTFAQKVPTGQVAVTVSVDQVHGVAGLLLPGDKVDMLVATQDPRKQDSDPTKSGVNVLYQNVDILAIGAKAAPQAGDTTAQSKTATQATTDSGLITFAVPLDAAQRIVFASNGTGGSSIYLALVPPDNQPINPRPGEINGGNILNSPSAPVAVMGATPYPPEAK